MKASWNTLAFFFATDVVVVPFTSTREFESIIIFFVVLCGNKSETKKWISEREIFLEI